MTIYAPLLPHQLHEFVFRPKQIHCPNNIITNRTSTITAILWPPHLPTHPQVARVRTFRFDCHRARRRRDLTRSQLRRLELSDLVVDSTSSRARYFDDLRARSIVLRDCPACAAAITTSRIARQSHRALSPRAAS